MRLDQVAQTLLSRIEELLAARPDLSRAKFAAAIKRGDSWISEFFNGKRTTNDLRLVIRMARFFAVPVGFLLNERSERRDDAQTASLLGAWEDLSPEHREIVMQLAQRLRQLPTPNEK